MEKRRSKGVKIGGIVTIIVAVCYLIMSHLLPYTYLATDEQKLEYISKIPYLERIKSVEEFDKLATKTGISSLIFSIYLFVSGIGILRLRNWARWLLIFYCIYYMIMWLYGIITTGHFYMRFFSIVCCFMFYFFTRPKVKEQFK